MKVPRDETCRQAQADDGSTAPLKQESNAPHTPSNQDDARAYPADAIARLKRTAFRLANQRGKLPQPLFWSLFFGEVRKLRSEKEALENFRRMLDGVDLG